VGGDVLAPAGRATAMAAATAASRLSLEAELRSGSRAEHLGELGRPDGRDLARVLGGEAERLLRAQPGVGVATACEAAGAWGGARRPRVLRRGGAS